MKKKFTYLSIIVIPLLGGAAARLLRVIIAFALRDLGISVFEITILSSAYMLTRALFSPIIGKFADAGGAKRHILVMIGFAGLLVDSQLYLHLPYFGILALRSLDGIFGAMVWPTMQALVHFSSPGRMRARIMSGYFVMGSVGMSAGYLLYSYFSGGVMRAILLLAVIYSAEILLALAFRETKEERKKKKEDRAVEKFGISLFTLTFFFGMYMSLGNEVLLFYLAEVIGVGKVDSTLILFGAGIIALIGSILLGHAADKKGFDLALKTLGILAPASAIMLAVNSVPIVIAGTILFFVAGRGFMPISRSFTASTSRNIGTSLGFVNLASNLGSVISPLIGGAILDYTEGSQVIVFNLSAVSFVAVGIIILANTIWFQRQYFQGTRA